MFRGLGVAVMSTRRTAALAGVLITLAAYGYWTLVRHGEPFKDVPPLDIPMPLAEGGSYLEEPRAGLSPAELAAFQEGKNLFRQKPPTMGPLYNAETCAECHFAPTIGGGGSIERAAHVCSAPSGDFL